MIAFAYASARRPTGNGVAPLPDPHYRLLEQHCGCKLDRLSAADYARLVDSTFSPFEQAFLETLLCRPPQGAVRLYLLEQLWDGGAP